MNLLNWMKLGALSVLWGASFLFVETALRGFGPLTLVWVRVTLAAAVLWGVAWKRRERVPSRLSEWMAYAVMGGLANVLPFGLISWGQQSITAGMASMLNATVPLFTVLLGLIIGKSESLGWRKTLGVVVGFTGVACLFDGDGEGWRRASLGQLAVLGAAVCYAAGAIYGKRFKDCSPLVNAAAVLSCSAVVLAPVTLGVEQPFARMSPDGWSWASLIALSVLSTAVAYVLYFGILASEGATRLSLVTYLIPVVSVSLGCWILGEQVGGREMISMAVIFGGLALVDSSLIKRAWGQVRRLGGHRSPTESMSPL